MPMPIVIRELRPADHAWAVQALTKEWGRPFVVSRGRGHHADRLPGLVAEIDGAPAGLLTYDVSAAGFEVVTIQALEPRRGAGTALLRAAETLARKRGCHRLWLVTTNDNQSGIAFYRAAGMRLAAVHAGALVESRRLKPDIPLHNDAGVPIADEWEFEVEV